MPRPPLAVVRRHEQAARPVRHQPLCCVRCTRAISSSEGGEPSDPRCRRRISVYRGPPKAKVPLFQAGREYRSIGGFADHAVSLTSGIGTLRRGKRPVSRPRAAPFAIHVRMSAIFSPESRSPCSAAAFVLGSVLVIRRMTSASRSAPERRAVLVIRKCVFLHVNRRSLALRAVSSGRGIETRAAEMG